MNKKLIWGIVIAAIVIWFGIATWNSRELLRPGITCCDKGLYPHEPSMADWKTYTNTKYGFEFKYPPLWDLESLDYVPVPHQPSQLGVSIFFKPPGTLILLSINFLDSVAQTEEMINTSKGYFRKLADNGKNVFTAHLPKDYTVPEIFKQDYETILATFKFTR
ncbi:MAG: hypothetical protein WCI76_01095 [bacterium]